MIARSYRFALSLSIAISIAIALLLRVLSHPDFSLISCVALPIWP